MTIEATGPDGWVGYPDWAMDGPEPVRADAPTGIGIAFFTANGVYSDPCHWDVKGTGQRGQRRREGRSDRRRHGGRAPRQHLLHVIGRDAGDRSTATPARSWSSSCRTIRSPTVTRTIPTMQAAMRSCSPGRASTPRARPTAGTCTSSMSMAPGSSRWSSRTRRRLNRPRSRAEHHRDTRHHGMSSRAEALHGAARHTRAAPSRFPSGSRA